MEIKDDIFFLLIILLISFIFIRGFLLFCLNYQHLLINLIRIEFIILRIFRIIYSYILLMRFEISFSIIFLSFIVGEGVLGLSLLISIVRSFGNNYFQSLNLF